MSRPEFGAQISVEFRCTENSPAAEAALENAILCGELLLTAKAELKHGEWLPWLEKSTTIGARQAQNYMRVAGNREALAANAKPASHLKAAVGLLARPKDHSPVAPPLSGRIEGSAQTAPRPKLIRKAELHELVSLEQWEELPPEEQKRLASLDPAWGATGFNKQTGDLVGWAQWTWNPVTGCKHTCVYCYARTIAHSQKMADSYPFGFEPTFHPRRLLAPGHFKPPQDAETDFTARNVFVCSMADLFGRWVPREWIQAVLDVCSAAPWWRFLFLTKFPQRLPEFDLPPNGWFGTTVDLQSRVKNAEEAFDEVRKRSPDAQTWLSCEPMLEPLKFKRLDLFDWVVIGGASPSSATADSPATPEWKPPFLWVADLTLQAKAANCRVWHKENLLGSKVREMMDGLPVPQDPQEAPEVFQYLRRQTKQAA